MENNNCVTVAYAILNNYECMMISMFSILNHAKPDTFIKFAVLIDSTVTEKIQMAVRHFLSGFEHCNVEFLNVRTMFSEVKSRMDFITNATFFRLALPMLLDEDRCIYLDYDTLIEDDLRDLYRINMKDNYIAGVIAPSYYVDKRPEEYCRQARLPDLKQYINAGMLVMDLKAMRAANITERFLELLSCNMWSQDQDIINSVCYGRILHLPFAYNVMTKYASWRVEDYEGAFEDKEIAEAWNRPRIIHYADRTKPWDRPGMTMGDRWWRVCRNSALGDYFLKAKQEEIFYSALYGPPKTQGAVFNRTLPLHFNLHDCGHILIYGAGTRAKRLLRYLSDTGISPECIIVSDKKNQPHSLDNIPVFEIGDLDADFKEYVIFIATLEKYHIEILRAIGTYCFREIIPLSDGWENGS